MLTYEESRPEARLRGHVLAFWTWDASLAPGDRFEHHVWPDGCVSLAISRRGTATPTGTVVGPCVEPRRLTMSGEVMVRGVRFRPEAGAAMLGVRATELASGALPLDALIGDDAAPLVRAVAGADTHRAGLAHLRAWTRGRLTSAAALDAVVTRAVDAMRETHGQIAMRSLATSLALSPRQLQRRFVAAVGLTPKQYARIRRMRSLLAVVMAQDEAVWAALAAEAGYADQAHCARELAAMTGLSPRALAVRLHAIRHEGVEP